MIELTRWVVRRRRQNRGSLSHLFVPGGHLRWMGNGVPHNLNWIYDSTLSITCGFWTWMERQMVKHQGHQTKTTHYIFWTCDLSYTIVFSLSVVPTKKPAAYKTKTFHVGAVLRGALEATWGGLRRSGARFPSKTDVTFPRRLQGERSKPSPETTKGDAWLHLRLQHFTL